MAIYEVAIEEKLRQFIKEYADDPYCLELLRFFGRHPNTQFDHLATIHALNGQRLYIELALRRLINEGMLRTYIENNVPRYSLSEDESLRSLVLDLAKLDWSRWQLTLRQIYQHPRNEAILLSLSHLALPYGHEL